MVTDIERREVAANLRESAENSELLRDASLEEILTGDTGLAFGEDILIDALLRHLADLIEPSEPKVKCVAEVKVDGERLEELVHDAVVELTGIDRDALLELADELEEDARWEVQSPGVDNCAWRLKDVCDRIREALGVDE